MTIVAQNFDHVIGVDTHARTHTLTAVNALGAAGPTATFPTTDAGLARAVEWIRRTAPDRTLVAMEGTASYGAVFCDRLQSVGFLVAETRPPKRGTRIAGKSDSIDAELAARHTLALPVERLLRPRAHTGDYAALSVLVTARRALTTARTATANELIALCRTHRLDVDARTALTAAQILQVSRWHTRTADSAAATTIRDEAIRRAQELLRRTEELERNLAGLTKHVAAIAPWLLEELGIGPVTAAQLLVSYSGKGRIHSEAAFARLAGAAPIPASSGNTTRHRLHRGGDRQLNSALWTIAFQRYTRDATTQAYVAKRTAAGHTRREILRSLKRYLARSLFRKMNALIA